MRIEFSPACDGDSFARVVGPLHGAQVAVLLTNRPAAKAVVDCLIFSVTPTDLIVTLTDKDGEPLTDNNGYFIRERYPWENVETVTYQ